jgi:hypothetical protein
VTIHWRHVTTSTIPGRYTWERALIKSDAPAVAIAVARALLHHYPIMRPGVDLLAAEMRQSRATVKRGISWLRRNGWIEIEKRASGPGRGRSARGTATTWSLALPP